MFFLYHDVFSFYGFKHFCLIAFILSNFLELLFAFHWVYSFRLIFVRNTYCKYWTSVFSLNKFMLLNLFATKTFCKFAGCFIKAVNQIRCWLKPVMCRFLPIPHNNKLTVNFCLKHFWGFSNTCGSRIPAVDVLKLCSMNYGGNLVC